MLKPQSIRKGVIITINDNEISKDEIINLSKDWTEYQIEFFKKMLKQGGTTNINGNPIKITLSDKVVKSNGEKEPSAIVFPGSDVRF